MASLVTKTGSMELIISYLNTMPLLLQIAAVLAAATAGQAVVTSIMMKWLDQQR